MSDTTQTENLVQLLTQMQRRLYLYIHSMIPQRTDVEEVLQEVNLFIWRRAEEYRPGTDFAAWAYKIAYFHVLTHRKRYARQKLRFSDELVEQLGESAVASADRTDLRQEALEECVRKLGPEDRDLVRLRYEVGSSTQTVASQLGRSVKAVYYALNRVHMRLMACIERSLRSEGT